MKQFALAFLNLCLFFFYVWISSSQMIQQICYVYLHVFLVWSNESYFSRSFNTSTTSVLLCCTYVMVWFVVNIVACNLSWAFKLKQACRQLSWANPASCNWTNNCETTCARILAFASGSNGSNNNSNGSNNNNSVMCWF